MKHNNRIWRLLFGTAAAAVLIGSCASCAFAIATDIELHNEWQNGLWVNWYPEDLAVDDEVRDLADQLRAANTQDALPKAIHDWVCDNIYYDYDALDDETYSALRADDVLRDRKAVCEGIANLVQGLFISLEIPCIKTYGIAVSDTALLTENCMDMNRVNHTWNEFYVDGRWYPVDCTMDMHNRYESGTFISGDRSDTFFAQESAAFAQTHIILHRGTDNPENVPSEWAIPELTAAVNSKRFALSCFSQYHRPITKEAFYKILGDRREGANLITRSEAARILYERCQTAGSSAAQFSDLDECDEETREAVLSLRERGIVRGIGSELFLPNAFLTRQEAIVLVMRYFESEG